MLEKHAIFEKNSIILTVGILVVVAIGGLVELVPNFYLKSTIEKVEGMRPFTPLELTGRNIYIREGCYLCHSQMIRTLRDDVERYGHFSLAAESMYNHPFQWGSKRTGPDLARVGGKYSNAWHLDHLNNPRSVVPPSIMPAYPWFAENELDARLISDALSVNRIVGVPYTDEMIENAAADLKAQADPDSEAADSFLERYPDAIVSNFDGNQRTLTEMDAVIAYLQVLGTMVDFSVYDDQADVNLR